MTTTGLKGYVRLLLNAMLGHHSTFTALLAYCSLLLPGASPHKTPAPSAPKP